MTFYVEYDGWRTPEGVRPATADDITEEMVERAARVLWEDDAQEHDYSWEPNRETYRALARRVLAAALEEGQK